MKIHKLHENVNETILFFTVYNMGDRPWVDDLKQAPSLINVFAIMQNDNSDGTYMFKGGKVVDENPLDMFKAIIAKHPEAKEINWVQQSLQDLTTYTDAIKKQSPPQNEIVTVEWVDDGSDKCYTVISMHGKLVEIWKKEGGEEARNQSLSLMDEFHLQSPHGFYIHHRDFFGLPKHKFKSDCSVNLSHIKELRLPDDEFNVGYDESITINYCKIVQMPKRIKAMDLGILDCQVNWPSEGCKIQLREVFSTTESLKDIPSNVIIHAMFEMTPDYMTKYQLTADDLLRATNIDEFTSDYTNADSEFKQMIRKVVNKYKYRVRNKDLRLSQARVKMAEELYDAGMQDWLKKPR